MAGGETGLSAALEMLRAELEQAWRAGRGRPVRFRVSELSLTLQVVARAEKKAGGKLRWYVVEAGADTSVADESTQTLVLTLTPALYDDRGATSPLDVSGDQEEPGQ